MGLRMLLLLHALIPCLAAYNILPSFSVLLHINIVPSFPVLLHVYTLHLFLYFLALSSLHPLTFNVFTPLYIYIYIYAYGGGGGVIKQEMGVEGRRGWGRDDKTGRKAVWESSHQPPTHIFMIQDHTTIYTSTMLQNSPQSS